MANNVTSIDIVNQALALLGGGPITSLSGGSVEESTARLFYDRVHHALLSEYPWRFASKVARLPKLSTKPLQFQYAYALPADYIMIQGIKTDTGLRGQEYEILGRELITDQENAHIEYTYKVAAENCPAHYITVLAYKLAVEFAPTITGSNTDVNRVINIGEQYYAKSKGLDAKQQTPKQLPNSPLVKARKAGYP